MSLTAKITHVDLTDELPVFTFELHDDEETAEVSLTSTVSLSHACFVVEHEPYSKSAYYQMLEAIAEEDDSYNNLVNRTFTS